MPSRYIIEIFNELCNMLDKIQEIRIEDYDYDLPEERIAHYPLAERSQSRLLIYRSGEISETIFSDLPNQLPQGCILIRNASKVIRARLRFCRPSGAQIETFCLDPLEPTSYELSLGARQGCTWHCLLGNARRWRISEQLEQRVSGLALGEVCVRATRISSDQVRFEWDNEAYTFGDILEHLGELPIPPYLNRSTEATDLATYQTVYARHAGSVAAPTAGLHFTNEVLDNITKRGIIIGDVTLHVGAGTFRPVKADTIGAHDMHQELIVVSRETLSEIRQKLGNIIAVGTTSIRTLESLYHLGRIVLSNPNISPSNLHLDQWTAYDDTFGSPSSSEALHALELYLERNALSNLIAPTAILIAPGYTFRLVRGLITNFHQPRSTLLLLISALIGEDWHKVYDHALANGFRFLSYGDSSLLLP